MALSNEDKKDVKHAFGKKVAGAVSNATQDKKMESWRKETIKVHGGNDFKSSGNLKSDAHKAISNMAKKMIGEHHRKINSLNPAALDSRQKNRHY